ncbi:MAG: TatD family hydrolase [Muribaculaceae bacterium]|nr:TatD family hydrolase [Muribaculaceae bacterium]
MTDTHTHMFLPEFDSDGGGEAAVRRAIESGVERMIFPCVDNESLKPMKKLSEMFPENVFMAIGLHPTEVRPDWRGIVDGMLAELDSSDGRYIAIGEVGMDLYWDKSMAEEQMAAFEYQAKAAAQRNLPMIVHCREALDETLEVLRGVPGVQAVFHSFGGSSDDVERIRCQIDPWFGINGIVTFKNSGLRETLPAIGLNRLLLETDAPYLAPVPRRGKRNESSYLVHTAMFIAEKLGISIEEIAETTNYNADKCFSL